jgi:mono/diheme cytochrome c family protein
MSRSLVKGLVGLAAALVAAASVVPARSLADNPQEEWKAPARAARKKNPIPADAKSIATGKSVYAGQCLSCHGPAGRGDGPAAKDLNPKPRNLSDPAIQSQTDGSMFWKLTEGRKPMPTFEKLISEDDRWNVINYVRTLAAKGAKP